MTGQEAIIKIKDFGLYHAIGDLPHSSLTVEAFNMAIKALEEAENNRWIPVNEMMPHPYDIGTLPILEQPHYLIQRANGLCAVAKYEHIYEDCWINEHSYSYDDVIAWRELPEPYMENV